MARWWPQFAGSSTPAAAVAAALALSLQVGRADDVLVGFGSCLMQSKFMPHESQGYRPHRVLDRVAEHGFDSFVFLGDAVYADFPDFYSSGCCSRPPSPTCDARCFENGTIGSREQLDRKYRLLLDDPHFARFIEKVPTVFTWDDHELFDNYQEGMEHVHYVQARSAWERHLAHKYNPAPYREGALYFVHKVPALPAPTLAEFFVLDGRSHRSEHGILGQQQLADLEGWLMTPSTSPWRFVVSSTMFADVASGVGSDNWSKHPDEKRRVLNLIYASGLEGVILISGDAHFVAAVEHKAEWSGAACRVLEVASSPLAAVPLSPKGNWRSYTGARHGFNEEVKFLQSGDHLYATASINATTAVFRLWRFEEREATDRILAEAVVPRWPVCDPVPGKPLTQNNEL